jgi:formylmethanofuran dehydrogenase subunit D
MPMAAYDTRFIQPDTKSGRMPDQSEIGTNGLLPAKDEKNGEITVSAKGSIGQFSRRCTPPLRPGTRQNH